LEGEGWKVEIGGWWLSLAFRRLSNMGEHGRIEKGVVIGVPKVLPGPAMPDPSMPRRLVTPSGVARPQGRRAAAVFHPFGHPTPNAYAFKFVSTFQFQFQWIKR
jgi:hypothetical protein